MKGFVVLLKPKDESGVARNQQYMKLTKGMLADGGIAELLPDNSLRCSWIFPVKVPDKHIAEFKEVFTKGLDEAIKRKDNIEYEVLTI